MRTLTTHGGGTKRLVSGMVRPIIWQTVAVRSVEFGQAHGSRSARRLRASACSREPQRTDDVALRSIP